MLATGDKGIREPSLVIRHSQSGLIGSPVRQFRGGGGKISNYQNSASNFYSGGIVNLAFQLLRWIYKTSKKVGIYMEWSTTYLRV